MSYEDFEYDPEYEAEERDDPAVVSASRQLLDLFADKPDEVYYENQLVIRFEDEFFHWVTSRALKELWQANKVGTDLQPLLGQTQIRFYFHKRNRYWKRRAAEIKSFVLRFSEPAFTKSLGLQGESMIDAGLPRVGFMPLASNVREWNGRRWSDTNHDLDRVFSRDGLHYGLEIKNKLGYIDQEEFRIKLEMCKHLRLVPLFVARFMPRTYMNDVRVAGGFSLLMKYQFYPFAHASFAKAVRESLFLPVDCPDRLNDGTLNRLLTWHERNLDKNRTRQERT